MNSERIAEYYDSEEYLDKLRAKLELMQEMEENEFLRRERILDVYSVDPVRFIEDFVMLKFSEASGDPKPFFLFPYQIDIVHRIQEAEMAGKPIDLLVDKPRGMGLTWLISAYFMWRFLFTPNYSSLILSRKEDLVDDGTDLPDETIFGKIRWMLKRLPAYMIPEGFSFKKARGTTTDMTLKLINPQIGSSINGSSTNSNAGRSGRFSIILVDECFFIEHFQQVYNSLTSVAWVKIWISTTVQSRMAEDFKKSCEARGTYLTLTWRDHPFKDEQWYNDLVARADEMNNPDLMREAEVSYSLSPKSRYYPEIEEALVIPAQFDRNLPLYCSLDFGIQDLTVILWWQYKDGKLILLGAYMNRNRPAEWYAPFLNPERSLELNPEHYNKYQLDLLNQLRSWKKPAAWFGELDHVKKVMPMNKSTADVLAHYGIKIVYNPYAIEHETRRQASSRLIPRMVFNSESAAVMKVYDAIGNSRYANSVRTTTENKKPVHDPEIADMRAALENMCVNLPRVLRSQRADVPKADHGFAVELIKFLKA